MAEPIHWHTDRTVASREASREALSREETRPTDSAAFADTGSGFPPDGPAAPSPWLEGGWAILDAAGRIRTINEALGDWFDAAPATLAGRDFWALVTARCPAQAEEISAVPKAGAAGAGITGLMLDWAPSDGAPVRRVKLEVARLEAESVVRLESVVPGPAQLAEDSPAEYPVTDSVQRQLWARLTRAEAQLKLLSEQWPGVIFSQRADFSFRFISPQIEALTGVAVGEWERRPETFWEAVHEADAAGLREQLARARVRREAMAVTYRLRHAGTGRIVYVLEHRRLALSSGGLVLGYEGVWLDVTRQTLAERRLSSAAWKETLSVLTMALAHDFSNVMAGIHALVESIVDQAGDDVAVVEELNLVKQNSRQASELVHRIIDLHQGRPGECYHHDLNAVGASLAELVRKTVPRRTRLVFTPCSRPLPVYLDAVELRQVLVGLVMNAVDAMKPEGRLIVRVDACDRGPRAGRQWGCLKRWPAAALSVIDDGCGMTPDQLTRIFEPFYSTKSGHAGTGLGLYNAREFVDRCGGMITVESAPGAGSVVTVLFPEADFAEGEGVRPERRRPETGGHQP